MAKPLKLSAKAEGMLALQRGDLAAAERHLRAAITSNGADFEAIEALGIVALHCGLVDAALPLFERATVLAPARASAWVNRGIALNRVERFHDAITSFEKALAVDATLFSARVNLATGYHAVGRLDDAVAAMEAATSQVVDSAEAWNNLGNFYKDQGRLAAALGAYERALAVNPMLAEAASNRLGALKLSSQSPAEIFAAHRIWSAWFEASGKDAPLLTNPPDPDRALNIGYVSPDCHTALPAFLDPVWKSHDRSRFKIFAYFNNPQDPARLAELGLSETARVMRGVDDATVAAKIVDDGIDVLIDIAGHTGKNRLGVFVRKPAPVQITWLDYLSTTGLNAMDYRLTDLVADPDGHEAFHSENLLRLTPTQWCWQPDALAPAVSPRAAAAGAIVFGSFNNAAKLTDLTLARWARLLAAMPTARLLVAGVADGAARSRIAVALGCEPVRLTFLPRRSVADYRASFGEVDIALDPSPFSGATTTLDALWQGVPVLTLPGESSCSRSSASILVSLDLADWVASDEADFILRAKQHAADTTNLRALRRGLRARLQKSALLDAPNFTAGLERQFREAWRGYCVSRASPMHTAQRLTDARRAITENKLDLAMANLADLLRERPDWEIAKQDLARAGLAWARAHPEATAMWREPFTAAPAGQRVSAIICSIRPAYFAAIKKQLKRQFAVHDFEVIGIHDAKSLTEGYNRGAAQAKGDVLIFCHDDIDMVHDDFGARVLAHLQRFDMVGVAGSTKLVDADWGHAGAPHSLGQIIHQPPETQGYIYLAVGLHHDLHTNVAALDGVFIATHRAVWQAIQFDEKTFDGFHLYDIDFSFRAAAAGYKLAIPLDLLLIHFSTGKYDQGWQRFNLRFLAKNPELTNLPSARRFSSIHVKLQTLEQVEKMHATLRYHRFGDA